MRNFGAHRIARPDAVAQRIRKTADDAFGYTGEDTIGQPGNGILFMNHERPAG